MEKELVSAVEEFFSKVSDFITLVEAKDPRFVRRDGELILKDPLVPVLSEKAKELPEYKKLLKLLSEDSVFLYGLPRVGQWCNGDTLVEWMVSKAVKIDGDKFEIDSSRGKLYLENFYTTLGFKKFTYTIHQRILGLEMTVDKITLDEDTELVLLGKEELNREMPRISMLDIGMPYLDLTRHPVEVRCSVTQSGKKIKSNLFRPPAGAKENLILMSEKVFSALSLTKKGMIEQGPYSIKFKAAGNEELVEEEETMLSQFMLLVFRNKIRINEEDLPCLKRSYKAVSKIFAEGKVLHAALKRYILGSKRLSPEDKLVDYVIAWESLLLTVGGMPATNELSYRFAANGSSVLHWVSGGKAEREEAFELMRTVYGCRSTIVHGGEEKRLLKVMSKIKVEDLSALADDVGENLRKAILWFSEIEEVKRPYKEKGGWEKLLWNSPPVD